MVAVVHPPRPGRRHVQQRPPALDGRVPSQRWIGGGGHDSSCTGHPCYRTRRPTLTISPIPARTSTRRRPHGLLRLTSNPPPGPFPYPPRAAPITRPTSAATPRPPGRTPGTAAPTPRTPPASAGPAAAARPRLDAHVPVLLQNRHRPAPRPVPGPPRPPRPTRNRRPAPRLPPSPGPPPPPANGPALDGYRFRDPPAPPRRPAIGPAAAPFPAPPPDRQRRRTAAPATVYVPPPATTAAPQTGRRRPFPRPAPRRRRPVPTRCRTCQDFLGVSRKRYSLTPRSPTVTCRTRWSLAQSRDRDTSATYW